MKVFTLRIEDGDWQEVQKAKAVIQSRTTKNISTTAAMQILLTMGIETMNSFADEDQAKQAMENTE